MTTFRVLATAVCLALSLGAGQAAARCAEHAPGQKPQNTARDIVGADLDTIQDRGWIEFAVYADFPPYSWEEGGQPKGVDIGIGRIIAEALEVKPRFNFVDAGENLDADLRNNVWKGPLVSGRASNVMLHVPYDSEYACRVEQVVFTGQVYAESIAIAYRKDAYPEDKPVPAYFRFDTVAVENDTIADFYLTRLAGGQLAGNIRRFPSYADAMAALASGEVKAAMGPRGQLEHGLTDALDLHAPPLPGFGRGAWTLGVAIRHTWRPLAYAVDYAIEEALADGRIEAVFADHGLTFQPPVR